MSYSCPCHVNESWMDCALCRASRVGMNTYLRAQTRYVEKPSQRDSDTPHHIENESTPVTVSFHDAFSTMIDCLQIGSTKCAQYHAVRDHVCDSRSEAHYMHYHTPNFRPVTHGNQESRYGIYMTASPVTYSVSSHNKWQNDVRRSSAATSHKSCSDHSIKHQD